MWNGVKKLPPGNYIEIINNNFEICNYWKINNFENLDIDYNTAKSELEELLYDSVKLRLRSDVPFGAFLSGGLDSSALVALASKQLNSPLNTYTVKFEGKLGKDNYYANNYCPRRFFIGPYIGRKKLNNIMVNPTGLINTDLIILDIVQLIQQ